MQAHGQIVRLFFLREPEDSRDDSHRADADPGWTDVESASIRNDLQGGHHRVVVVEGFAHSHQHQIPEPRQALGSQGSLAVHELGHNFTWAEMPHKSHLPGGAENAAHRASGLGADAGGEATGVAHDDGFDALPVVEFQKEFAGLSIAAVQVGFDGGVIGKKTLLGGQIFLGPALQRRREMGALGEIDLQVSVHGSPESSCVRVIDSIRDQHLFQGLEREVVQRLN